MSVEPDYDLTQDQWEVLKALRVPAPKRRTLNRFIVERLVAFQLAAISGDCPVITEKGRKVLVRGSSRLWDVAAWCFYVAGAVILSLPGTDLGVFFVSFHT